MKEIVETEINIGTGIRYIERSRVKLRNKREIAGEENSAKDS